MSRIYDAIKSAEESRSSSSGLSSADFLGEMKRSSAGRKAPGKELGIDLTVYGRSPDEEAFYEQARAISGDAKGGVLLLAIPVVEGQDLLLINNGTSQEQLCSVVSVHTQDIKTLEVTVGFPSPNANFWKLPRKS